MSTVMYFRRHCTSGRYFPVSAKNLMDSTVGSLETHIASCSRCPEQVKSSLAYLGHRSVQQKAQLSGSWKKTFFKKVWDRLHVERAWEGGDNDDVAGEAKDDDSNVKEAASAGDDGGGSDTEEEELGEGMNALIQAAAIWLTEQDGSGGDGSRSRSARGRGLPNAKRPASSSPRKSDKGKSDSSDKGSASASPSKRRKVQNQATV